MVKNVLRFLAISTVVMFIITGLSFLESRRAESQPIMSLGVGEEDGDPTVWNPYLIKHPNGSVTDNADGTVSIAGTTPQQAIIVAKADGDFDNIQDAIDSISDNATDKRYAILIYPGIYTENIVMEEYVSLVGFDHESTEVTSTSGVTITAPSGASDAGIYELKMSSTPTADGATVLAMTTGEVDIYNSYLKMTSATNGVRGELVDITGGELNFDGCKFKYNLDGTSAGGEIHSIFNVPSGTVDYNIVNSRVIVDVADVDDTVVFINENSGAIITEDIIKDNIMHITLSNGSYSGAAGVFYLHGAGTNKQIANNHIDLTSSGDGTGYLFFMDTSAGTGVISALANSGTVEGFTNNYAGNVAAGDTLHASFISLSAAQGFTGAGTVNAVTSPSAGKLFVTGDAQINGVLLIQEQADADANIPAYGQIWVNTATPNELWWTDDEGTDTQLGTASISDKYIVCEVFTDEGINACIDALGAEGGEVKLLEGTYVVNDTITIDADNTTISGSGMGTHIDASTIGALDVFVITDKSGFTARDFKITGPSGSGEPIFYSENGSGTEEKDYLFENIYVADWDNNVFYLRFVDNIKVLNNTIRGGQNTYTDAGIAIYDAENIKILGNDIVHDATGYGVVAARVYYMQISDNNFENVSYGFAISDGYYVTIINNTMIDTVYEAIQGYGNPTENWTIAGNSIKDVGASGRTAILLSQGGGEHAIVGNVIEDVTSGTGIGIDAMDNVIIAGNTFKDMSEGIDFDTDDDGDVTGIVGINYFDSDVTSDIVHMGTNINMNAGASDTTSYWLCTANDCATTCQVTLSGGLITGCP